MIVFHRVIFLLLSISLIVFFVLLFVEDVRGIIYNYSVAILIYFSILFVFSGIFIVLRMRLLWKYNKQVMSTKWKLYEISSPEDFHKTAEAMERVFDGLALSIGESEVEGKTRPYFSVEIISIEGTVKLFIRTSEFLEKYMTSLFYSYYPEVELKEVDDYVNNINLKEWVMWACNFKTSGSDHLPIRTYVEFEKKSQINIQSAQQRTREHLESLAPLIEMLSSVSVNEQIWIQIIFRNYKDSSVASSEDFLSNYSLKEITNSKISELTKKKEDADVMTYEKKELINKIEQKTHKPKFEMGMRGIYFAKKDYYRPVNVVALVNAFKHFGRENINRIIPFDGFTVFAKPWDPISETLGFIKKGTLKNQITKRMFEDYRRRDYFYFPVRYTTSILSSEEMATLFHPLSTDVVRTATLSKTIFRKLDPPSNLPV